MLWCLLCATASSLSDPPVHQEQRVTVRLVLCVVRLGVRDAIMYHAVVFQKDVDAAIELLSEVVLRPELTQEEVRL